MSMHKCLHAHAACEKHMKSVFACMSLCLQVIFSFPFCSLREICRLALCIAKHVRMNNGGKQLCQRVREQQVRKKAGLSKEHTQHRLGFDTHGQTDTKTKLEAPRPGESTLPISADSLARMWATDCHPGIPITFSQQLKVQKHSSRCLKSGCTLDLVTDCAWSHWAGWSGAGLLLKTPLILTICLIII